MRKAAFLNELIEQYLYLTSIACIALENYTSTDYAREYAQSADHLYQAMEFYEQVYNGAECGKYSEEERDYWLEEIVQDLKWETVKMVKEKMKEALKGYIDCADTYVDTNFFPEKGKEGAEQFLRELHMLEQKGKSVEA